MRSDIVDVRKRSDVEGWLKNVVNDLGSLDGAANVAGVLDPAGTALIKDTTDEHWDFVMGVNSTGV